MRKFCCLLLLFSLGLPSVAQEELDSDLIVGQWIFETSRKDWYGELMMKEDGSFQMTSVTTGTEPIVNKGSYKVEAKSLILNFETGGQQVNEIKTLNKTILKFQYIETMYSYRRTNS